MSRHGRLIQVSCRCSNIFQSSSELVGEHGDGNVSRRRKDADRFEIEVRRIGVESSGRRSGSMRSRVDFFGDSRCDETKELKSCCWVTSGDGVEEGERHSSEFGVSDGVDGVASRDGGDDVELSDGPKRKEGLFSERRRRSVGDGRELQTHPRLSPCPNSATVSTAPSPSVSARARSRPLMTI